MLEIYSVKYFSSFKPYTICHQYKYIVTTFTHTAEVRANTCAFLTNLKHSGRKLFEPNKNKLRLRKNCLLLIWSKAIDTCNITSGHWMFIFDGSVR